MKRVLSTALLLTTFLISGVGSARADAPQFDLSSVQSNNSPAAYIHGVPVQNLQQLQQAANGILSNQNGPGAPLPAVSTGSVDFNTVDLPFIRSNGGNGAFPSAGGANGAAGGTAGNGSSQAPPALPPGYAGVMCHGVYAGAIPPGGNIVDFWKGAYGFAGDAQQQAALLEEGKWLAANGQLDGM